MTKTIKISLLVSAIFYLSLNTVVYFQGQYYKQQLQKFDINNSGFFERNEITPKQKIAFKKVSHDTARTFAPFVLIPVSIILGALTFIGLKLTRITKKYLKLKTNS